MSEWVRHFILVLFFSGPEYFSFVFFFPSIIEFILGFKLGTQRNLVEGIKKHNAAVPGLHVEFLCHTHSTHTNTPHTDVEEAVLAVNSITSGNQWTSLIAQGHQRCFSLAIKFRKQKWATFRFLFIILDSLAPQSAKKDTIKNKKKKSQAKIKAQKK